MAHVVGSLQPPSLHHKRIRTITACLLAILLVSFASGLASAATPGYGTVNLALGKTVTPLTGSALGSVTGVNDGGAGNYWYSFDNTTCASLNTCTETDNQGYYYTSFTIDLEAEYSIGRINIYPLQTRGLRVFSSLNGTEWTEQHRLDGFDTTGLKNAHVGPVTFEPQGAYTARYLKYEGWAWWDQYVGTYEFEVYEWQTAPAPLPSIGSLANLAAGMQAANSGGTVSPGQDAFPNLTDSDPFTFWQSINYADVCQYAYLPSVCPTGIWFDDYGSAYVDLGAPTDIQAIRLTFPAAAPGFQSYAVHVSNDAFDSTPYMWWAFGGDSKMVATDPPLASSATQIFYLPSPVNARYVWVTLINSTTAQPLYPSLAEIEVYGELPASSTYTISAAAGPNGAISPAGSVMVNSGSDQAFTISPHAGYQVESVRVDGVSMGAVTTYTFPSVAADHTISATFSSTSSTTTPIVTVIPGASSITTAQALMVTIAVSGTEAGPLPTGSLTAIGSMANSTPTGSVTLSSGSYNSPVTSLSGGQTIITIPAGALAVGNDTLTAEYTPDAGSPAFNSSIGSADVTVILAPPVASLNSSALSFSTIVGATSTAQTVQLSNTGGSPLTISSIALSGAGASAFAQTNNCGTSVAPGASCNISATFSPTSAANFSATLSITDDAAGSPHTISLTGAGLAFTVAASPATQIILPAHTATFAITVAAQNGTFSNAVALTATGIPPGATVTFAPASVTPGSSSATSTLTIQVPWSTASAGHNPGALWPLATPVLALLLPFIGKPRRMRNRLQRMLSIFLLVAAGVLAAAALNGCDANSGFFGQKQRTYTVTVTGTSGSLARSSAVTLTVE